MGVKSEKYKIAYNLLFLLVFSTYFFYIFYAPTYSGLDLNFIYVLKAHSLADSWERLQYFEFKSPLTWFIDYYVFNFFTESELSIKLVNLLFFNLGLFFIIKLIFKEIKSLGSYFVSIVICMNSIFFLRSSFVNHSTILILLVFVDLLYIDKLSPNKFFSCILDLLIVLSNFIGLAWIVCKLIFVNKNKFDLNFIFRFILIFLALTVYQHMFVGIHFNVHAESFMTAFFAVAPSILTQLSYILVLGFCLFFAWSSSSEKKWYDYDILILGISFFIFETALYFFVKPIGFRRYGLATILLQLGVFKIFLNHAFFDFKKNKRIAIGVLIFLSFSNFLNFEKVFSRYFLEPFSFHILHDVKAEHGSKIFILSQFCGGYKDFLESKAFELIDCRTNLPFIKSLESIDTFYLIQFFRDSEQIATIADFPDFHHVQSIVQGRTRLVKYNRIRLDDNSQ